MYALGVLPHELPVGEPPPVGAEPGPPLKRPDFLLGVETVIRQPVARHPEGRFL